MEFVSRAGNKLQHAIEQFKIDVSGKICADLGASTGGFVDCLLQNGATKVYAVETGYGVLDWKLRNDARVVAMERINALHVELPEKVSFISIDTGWTKQKLILAKAVQLLGDGGDIVTLVKPHYEAEKSMLDRGVLQEQFLDQVLASVRTDIEGLGLEILAETESPIEGKRGGNIEYLFWVKVK